MKIIEKSREKLVFVEELEEELANAIRRSALEIPILAIEDVEFTKNDSALYDQIIAHRLGLVPLKTPKTFDLKAECSCNGKGCNKCSVALKLTAKGSGTVYSGDLKGKAELVYDNMPIVTLEDEQELELAATAVLGTGIDHAKFSPGLVYYRNPGDLEEDKSFSDGKVEEVKKSGELMFFIESFGQIDASQIFVEAINCLLENIKKLKKE